MLKADPALPGCIARQLLTYALGRGMGGATDRCEVQGLAGAFAGQGYRMHALIVDIATSRAFTMRRGEK